MLALLIVLLLAKGYQIAFRQLPRGCMAVFLIVCGIATVKAQKTWRVDINKDKSGADADFKTIQEAFDYLNGKYGNYITISVAPGTYPPVDLTDFKMDAQGMIVELTPTIYVEAECGAGSVIIDGGGASSAVKMGEHEPFVPREWKGLVLSNAVCGGVGGSYTRCVATCCQTGFKDASLEHCLVYGNSCLGADGCSVRCSTIVDNHGYSDADAVHSSTGLKDCWVDHSIVWGNTKDGMVANIDTNNLLGTYHACIDPLVSGEGNICADPKFVDPANHNYHLQMGSPCINAGGAWPLANLEPDFDGNPRVQRGIIDIGAYEYQPTNDTQTITAPVPVEFAWVDEKCPDVLTAVGGDYDKAVLQTSANPVDTRLPEESRRFYDIWQSYLLDLDPTDSNATWYATIQMADGVPVVCSEPQSPNRKYTNLGKHTLTDEVWSATCEDPHFFKVKVELK